MKNFLFLCLQFVLFLIVFAAGSLFPPFHIERVLTTTPTITHLFVVDGLLLMLVLYAIIVIIGALMKRGRAVIPWTTASLILAAAVGLIMKFGFITHEL